MPRRRGGVGDDRQALDLDAADDRLVDRARQVGADLGDLVLDVVERAVDVDRADGELRRVTDEPSVTVEIMCQTPLMLETASSTFFRHLRFEFRRRGARLGDGDLDDPGMSMLGKRAPATAEA